MWLEKHYTKIHYTSGSNIRRLPPPFLAVFVGCNKGFDALNALRMGSGNLFFDKHVWNDAITEHGKLSLHRDVCNEVTRPQFDLPVVGRTTTPSPPSSSLFSEVHCIEPMPATARGKKYLSNMNLLIFIQGGAPSLIDVQNKISTPTSSTRNQI